MLYTIDNPPRMITDIPHHDQYQIWRNRLTDPQFDAICAEIRGRIDGDEVITAGWIPGNDWTGTVWEPIYTDACQRDVVASGYCFGLIVWVMMQEHPDAWAFGRYEVNNVEIRSLTYFRIQVP